MKFITLLTDFGVREGYVGVMKGVIYTIAPDVKIADLSHIVAPQDILEGSQVWKRSYEFFPENTVHVGVVDPGVGTARRPIAARVGKFFFVCPDNGLITPILEDAEKAGEPVEMVQLDQPCYWLSEVSSVFHGRDIFSPAAAHLANGVPLRELGTPITDPVRLSPPRPQRTADGWQAEIIAIDHFGNLGTNLDRQDLLDLGVDFKDLRVSVAGSEIQGLSKTFGERGVGELVAFIDSDNTLAIAVVNGSAARELVAAKGDPVEVHWHAK